MTDIRARVAYLQGLAEGLDVETAGPEGRVLSSMIQVLGDMADHLTEVAEAQDDLAEYVEDVDYDLSSLEESVYGTEGGQIAFVPDEVQVEDEDGVELLTCPNCGETLGAMVGDVNTGADTICPDCGSLVQTTDTGLRQDSGH